jgi:hypothetical protein
MAFADAWRGAVSARGMLVTFDASASWQLCRSADTRAGGRRIVVNTSMGRSRSIAQAA